MAAIRPAMTESNGSGAKPFTNHRFILMRSLGSGMTQHSWPASPSDFPALHPPAATGSAAGIAAAMASSTVSSQTNFSRSRALAGMSS
jgi:hypothetical protein